jgi:hypothetical protein
MTTFFSRRVFLSALLSLSLWTPSAFPGGQQTDHSHPAAVTAELTRPSRPTFEQFARTELYFGSAKPDGSVITEEEFRQFLDQEITPQFPDGLTLLVGLGQFRGANGVIVQERSMVVILFYPLPTQESSQKIEHIRDRYQQLFQQESVLRIDGRARVSF